MLQITGTLQMTDKEFYYLMEAVSSAYSNIEEVQSKLVEPSDKLEAEKVLDRIHDFEQYLMELADTE